MDRIKIIETLGLIAGGTFSITDVMLTQWGRELIFECDYQTLQPDGLPDELVMFRMIFRDCREFKWRSYAHIALSEFGEISLRTDVAEIALGQGNHRRDANLLTNHFALTVSYAEIVIERDTRIYHLSA
ncbi:MAG TPA: hypothetical protein VHL11_17875 [Phototrophicaceae bacterium]|nr:hypothetical protein [Phototrophicaceae bacterium]